jgi:hypothetical protein
LKWAVDNVLQMKLRPNLLFKLVPLLSLAGYAAPLALHPENPHYFQYHGRPTIILTSGEHYGAVLNLDFNYVAYLDTLKRDGLNGTRTWSGAYCEPSSAFQIADNTLAPHAGRFICPWARSDQSGYANGGNKFDLNQWDPAYFSRLRDFVNQARKKGVIVEMNLFCPFYDESMWTLSPMNSINNINGIGGIGRTNVYTLDKNQGLLAVQDAMVEKIVTELRDFENLYYEICNEPYFGGVTLEWQGHIAEVIRRKETDLGVKHLVSRNVANEKAKVENPHPAVSIFNFHYATPPETVAMNYQLNKVIGDNETGFRGTNDAQYRMEAWDFLVAGGGLYNNLDYSFTAGHENGTFVYPASQPGGGSPALRHQLGFLKHLFEGFDFVRMKPELEAVGCDLPEGASIRTLARTGKEYLVYIRTGLGDWQKHPERKVAFAPQELRLKINMPAGKYSEQWLDPARGALIEKGTVSFEGETNWLPVPGFQDDIALVLRRR